MRDLGTRLREIVRREKGSGIFSGASSPEKIPDPFSRELTYIPDPDPQRPNEHIAALLGGSLLNDDPGCVVVDRVWAHDRSHGRKRIETCLLDADSQIALFDPRVIENDGWWRRLVFFDIETTGLSGGAGTLAFLCGVAWFDDEGLRVRQFFLSGPAGEKAMLAGLADVFRDASLLVTYNGRTFDVPLMETRWAFHRAAAPTDGMPHFDMLPPARRLWGRSWIDEKTSCSLSTLERSVLGFHRLGDVPGFEIPARYFQFLRTGDPELIAGVLDHNRHDLVSLAVITAHALWLVREGPLACREPAEQVALGRVYERAGDNARAIEAYEAAASSRERDVRRHALARLAVLLRRESRFDAAAAAWQSVLDLAPSRATMTALERRAAEALAIHHEHRARDLTTAERYAKSLSADARGREQQDVERRLHRLSSKIQKAENTKGGPQAAPLLD